jgi:hypothetical protein
MFMALRVHYPKSWCVQSGLFFPASWHSKEAEQNLVMPKFTAPQARLASFSGKSGALCLFSLRAAHNFLREKKFTVAKKRSA